MDTSEYDKNLSDASGQTDSLADKLKGGLGTAAKAGAAAIAAGSAAVLAFGKSAVDAGQTFDSSMSQVAATMGTTVDQIGELRDFAQEMGATTAFSASEAADALNYMALAGYDSSQAMEALPNVLNLAAAGGIDLARASDMVTDAQSALGLSMDESAELVDKMAKASSKSNTSVAQLGDAILTVGGTAKNLAGGTTELSTALGILADNGVKGAEGGTALRNIILSLSAPTDNAAAAMKSLGLEVFDAEGNMRPLNETFSDLEAALGQLSQEERIGALNAIFNKVDLKSVNALLANSGERFTELSSAIDDATGAAQEMAETQLDNLAGDITIFQSALEGVKIAISDKITPALREFVQFGSDGLSRLTDAFKNGGLNDALDVFSDILDEGIGKLFDALPRVVEIGGKVVFSLASGIVKNIPKLAESLMEGVPLLVSAGQEMIASLLGKLREKGPDWVETAKSLLAEFAAGAREAAGNLLSKAADFLRNNGPKIAEGVKGLLGKAADAILTALPVVIQGIGELYGRALEFIGSKAPDVLRAVGDLVKRAGETLLEKGPDILNAIGTGIGKIVGAIVKHGPKILTAGIRLVGELALGIIQGIPKLIAAIPELVKGFLSGFLGEDWSGAGGEAIGKLLDGISNVLTGIGGWFSEKFTAAKDAIVGVFAGIGTWFSDKFSEARENAASAWDGIKGRMSDSWEAIKGVFSPVGAWFGEKFEAAKGAASSAWDGIKVLMSASWEGIKTIFSPVAQWFSERFAEAKEKASAAWDKMREAAQATWDGVKKIYDVVAQWFEDTFSKAKDKAAAAWDKIKEKMSESWEAIKGVFAAVGSWFSEKFTEAKDKASSAFAGIKDKMSEHWESVKGVFSGLADWFKEKFAEAKDKAVGAWSDIKEKFSEIKDRIKEGLSIDSALEWGKDLVQNFINGITAKWDALKETVSNVAGTVKDFLGFSEPKRGPLSNFHTYAPDMMDLFIKGIRDNEPKLWKQIARTFGFDLLANVKGLSGSGVGNGAAMDKFAALYEKLNNYETLEENVKGIADPFYAIGMSMTELVDALNESANQEEFTARMLRDYDSRYGEFAKYIWDEMSEAAREVALTAGNAAAEQARETAPEAITINVYPSPGMDENRLAELIDRKLAERYYRRRAVFG